MVELGLETQQKLYGRAVFETYRDFIAGGEGNQLMTAILQTTLLLPSSVAASTI